MIKRRCAVFVLHTTHEVRVTDEWQQEGIINIEVLTHTLRAGDSVLDPQGQTNQLWQFHRAGPTEPWSPVSRPERGEPQSQLWRPLTDARMFALRLMQTNMLARLTLEVQAFPGNPYHDPYLAEGGITRESTIGYSQML